MRILFFVLLVCTSACSATTGSPARSTTIAQSAAFAGPELRIHIVASLMGATLKGKAQAVLVHGSDKAPPHHIGFSLEDPDLKTLLDTAPDLQKYSAAPNPQACYNLAVQFLIDRKLDAAWEIAFNSNISGHCWRQGGWAECQAFMPYGFVLFKKGSKVPFSPKPIGIHIDPNDPQNETKMRHIDTLLYVVVQPDEY